MSTSSAGLKLSASIDDWGGTLVGASVDRAPITGISPASGGAAATTLQEMSARPDPTPSTQPASDASMSLDQVDWDLILKATGSTPGGRTAARLPHRLHPGASTSDGAGDLYAARPRHRWRRAAARDAPFLRRRRRTTIRDPLAVPALLRMVISPTSPVILPRLGGYRRRYGSLVGGEKV